MQDLIHIQFHLNVSCGDDPAAIIEAINCKDNINHIILCAGEISGISQLNIEDHPIHISIYPLNKHYFIIEDLSPILVDILHNETFINSIHYELFIKSHFKDNVLMMNKWLRYTKHIRGLN